MINISMLQSPDSILSVPALSVDNLLWGTKSIPKTTIRPGWIPDDGLYLHLRCDESDPLRTYTCANDPVYRDSAMEAFFSFSPKDPGFYLNFECNANGALLAMFGRDRHNRTLFTPKQIRAVRPSAKIFSDYWTLDLHIPFTLLQEIYNDQGLQFKTGSRITCNFYKISEDPDHLHFAAYAPVDSPQPDFHRPDCFAEAVLC